MPSLDVIDELDDSFGNWVALVIKEPEFYLAIDRAFVKKLANTRNLRGIYITINKPFDVIESSFRKSDVKIGNIYFVDVVTKYMNKKAPEKENCSFVDSPSDLTTLAITFMQAAKMIQEKSKFDKVPVFVVVDSINTFLIYNEENTVKRFFHFLISKCRELGCKLVLFSSNVDEVTSLNRVVGAFSDKVINYAG